MAYQVTLIPGDGIGPEVSTAARRVVDATGVPIAWEEREAGLTALESQGDVLPEETLTSLKRNTVGLKGPMTTPIGSGFRSVNVGLRQALGLYANLRPGKSLAGVQSVFRDIDLVVVRENLEGMYTGIESKGCSPNRPPLPPCHRLPRRFAERGDSNEAPSLSLCHRVSHCRPRRVFRHDVTGWQQ